MADAKGKLPQQPGEGNDKPTTMAAAGDPAIPASKAAGGAGIAAAENRGTTMPSNISALADRILVASSGAERGRVDITVQNSILPDTRISLQMEGAVLHVDITSASAQSLTTLNAHIDGLQQTLSQSMSHDLEIRVHDQSGDSEGRSRQKYVAEDDEEGDSS